jgi:hypothetical protein
MSSEKAKRSFPDVKQRLAVAFNIKRKPGLRRKRAG